MKYVRLKCTLRQTGWNNMLHKSSFTLEYWPVNDGSSNSNINNVTISTSVIYRPVFQDNTGKPIPQCLDFSRFCCTKRQWSQWGAPTHYYRHINRVVFVGGSRGTSPSLDLAFLPTGLSENFPARERVIPRHC